MMAIIRPCVVIIGIVNFINIKGTVSRKILGKYFTLIGNSLSYWSLGA